MLCIALLHYPVYNKKGEIVTTAIANMDVHDIARVAKTYGVQKFYIVNPIEEQSNLAFEIITHWREGYGANFNKHRHAAFELIAVKEDLQCVIADILEQSGFLPKLIVTGANFSGDVLKFSQLKEMLQSTQVPYLIIFGTGSGMFQAVSTCEPSTA